MKKFVQASIRAFHRAVMRRNIPDKLALYFHALEPKDWPLMEELAAWLTDSGRATFHSPEGWLNASGKATFISFDDNYKSWHTSLPLLEKVGIKATFYVNTLPFRDWCSDEERVSYFDRIEHEGERIALSLAELREIRAAGHIIGCHTHSHRRLNVLPLAEAQEEIRRAKEILEEQIQEEVVHFSFPFGFRRHFPGALRKWCPTIGLRTIAEATPGQLHRNSTPWRIERHVWRFDRSLPENQLDLSADGRLFAKITGRNPIA